ncbi:unnamed protein product [Closterium sp. NIES-54]
MESSGAADGRRPSRFSTQPPNPLSLLSRRVQRGSAIAEALRKPNPLSLLSRRVLMASASLLHSPPSPSNPPVSPFLLPPSQLPLLPPPSPASPASTAPPASPKSPASLLASQPSPKTPRQGKYLRTEGSDEPSSRAALDSRIDSSKTIEWIPETPQSWLETWADPISSSWKEERVQRELGRDVGWKKEDYVDETRSGATARLDKARQLQTRMQTEAEKVKLAVQERSEALKRGVEFLQRDMETQKEAVKRGVVSLLWDVEAQNDALKRGLVSLQRDVEARNERLKRGLISLQRDVGVQNEALKRGLVSLQQDLDAQNEAVKRGMVALQGDVEAQSNRLKRGMVALQRDVEANVLSFQRGAEFWRRIVHLYGSYKLCQLQVAVSGQSEEEKSATWQRQHESGAEMLYALCTDMKGFFLKAGQFLAKPDLSPQAWVARLSALHDAAPADPLPLVLQTIQEELGGVGWREVWEWVEEKPLGSASIAQVHRGRLRGGKEVAIKVQHAGAEPLMLTDLANLKAFAAFLQSTELNLDVLGALNELEKQIRYEFDFRREAAAMDIIRASLAGSAASGTGAAAAANRRQKSRRRWNPFSRPVATATAFAALTALAATAPAATAAAATVGAIGSAATAVAAATSSPPAVSGAASPVVVPASVPGLVTQRLLVMDLINGSPIVKMEEEMRAKGVNPNGYLATRAKRSIFRSLGTAYGLMILRDGHFQADPHPGNLLICPDKKVALLDYGQTKRLPDSLRLNLARLMLAVADKDLIRVGSLFQASGIRTTRTVFEDPKSFHRMSSLMFDTAMSEGVTTSNPFASESTLKRNGIEKFPEDLFFVVRTMQLLRGLAMGMGLNESLAEQWRPIAQQALKEAGGT